MLSRCGAVAVTKSLRPDLAWMAGTGEGGEEEQIQGAPGVVGDGSLSSVG